MRVFQHFLRVETTSRAHVRPTAHKPRLGYSARPMPLNSSSLEDDVQHVVSMSTSMRSIHSAGQFETGAPQILEDKLDSETTQDPVRSRYLLGLRIIPTPSLQSTLPIK